MNFINEADWDRAMRFLAGLMLLIGGWSLAHQSLGIGLVAAGFVAIATGISAWCPIYTVFGWSTRKSAGPHCASCEPKRRV